jgi:translocation and assembly module TamB
MQADVEASIMPWRSQPLLAAKARLHNLDVSAFWPQGPRTLLTGQLQAGPDETVAPATNLEAQPWNLNTSFSNALPGPWDKQRLPVAELMARSPFRRPAMAGGRLPYPDRQGPYRTRRSVHPSTRLFEGLATVEQLNPADLYSTLEAALEGEISAKAVAEPAAAMPLPARLCLPPICRRQAASATARRCAFRHWLPAASGRPLLQLEKLQLEALQASVDASPWSSIPKPSRPRLDSRPPHPVRS